MKFLSPDVDGHRGDGGWISIPNFPTPKLWSNDVEGFFEPPHPLCMLWMSTYKQSSIHVSRRHSEALGINNV